MTENLKDLYLSMLKMGLFVLREAALSKNHDWVCAEIELSHNIPSLVEEENEARHFYFWNEEREIYLDKISAMNCPEALSRMRTYYEPIWQKMEPIIQQWQKE